MLHFSRLKKTKKQNTEREERERCEKYRPKVSYKYHPNMALK